MVLVDQWNSTVGEHVGYRTFSLRAGLPPWYFVFPQRILEPRFVFESTENWIDEIRREKNVDCNGTNSGFRFIVFCFCMFQNYVCRILCRWKSICWTWPEGSVIMTILDPYFLCLGGLHWQCLLCFDLNLFIGFNISACVSFSPTLLKCVTNDNILILGQLLGLGKLSTNWSFDLIWPKFLGHAVSH